MNGEKLLRMFKYILFCILCSGRRWNSLIFIHILAHTSLKNANTRAKPMKFIHIYHAHPYTVKCRKKWENGGKSYQPTPYICGKKEHFSFSLGMFSLRPSLKILTRVWKCFILKTWMCVCVYFLLFSLLIFCHFSAPFHYRSHPLSLSMFFRWIGLAHTNTMHSTA